MSDMVRIWAGRSGAVPALIKRFTGQLLSGWLVLMLLSLPAFAWDISLSGRVADAGHVIGTSGAPIPTVRVGALGSPRPGQTDASYITSDGSVLKLTNPSSGKIEAVCLRQNGSTVDSVCRGGVIVPAPAMWIDWGVISDGSGIGLYAPGEYDGMNAVVWLDHLSGGTSTTWSYASSSGSQTVDSWVVGGGEHSGQISAVAGPDLLPGIYSGQVTVNITGAPSQTFNYHVAVFNTLPTCQINPVPPVMFGDVNISQVTDVLLASKSITVSGNCTVNDPQASGMAAYLTFSGRLLSGVYSHRLATDHSGVFIVGGTDNSTAQCDNSLITWDNQVHHELKALSSVVQGDNPFSMPLVFSLCRDGGVSPGQINATAYVNVVIQ
ncbi:TPA: hypothetical protein ACGSNH_004410 [Escherichia coli]